MVTWLYITLPMVTWPYITPTWLLAMITWSYLWLHGPTWPPYLCWHTVGLLEQWLIEGNYTEEEAQMLSVDMLAAGIDTVSKFSPWCKYMGIFTFSLASNTQYMRFFQKKKNFFFRHPTHQLSCCMKWPRILTCRTSCTKKLHLSLLLTNMQHLKMFKRCNWSEAVPKRPSGI